MQSEKSEAVKTLMFIIQLRKKDIAACNKFIDVLRLEEDKHQELTEILRNKGLRITKSAEIIDLKNNCFLKEIRTGTFMKAIWNRVEKIRKQVEK